jgi:hypothetical protein
MTSEAAVAIVTGAGCDIGSAILLTVVICLGEEVFVT